MMIGTNGKVQDPAASGSQTQVTQTVYGQRVGEVEHDETHRSSVRPGYRNAKL
jgi:hypothetical protein